MRDGHPDSNKKRIHSPSPAPPPPPPLAGRRLPRRSFRRNVCGDRRRSRPPSQALEGGGGRGGGRAGGRAGCWSEARPARHGGGGRGRGRGGGGAVGAGARGGRGVQAWGPGWAGRAVQRRGCACWEGDTGRGGANPRRCTTPPRQQSAGRGALEGAAGPGAAVEPSRDTHRGRG